MGKHAITVENLGKSYRLGETERYLALRDVLSKPFRSAGRRLKNLGQGKTRTSNSNQFWALRDVSFEVTPGEVIGIIGHNGAGKTTLLKILSRITAPSAGRAEICGRVGSLLEVGTGFHPELTGRENILLNGAILGMGRAEIRRKFSQIVSFAEVERFIDTPVKRYSSGMYVRLAFAVAAHLEPEILLIDEVLAVGDAAFQKKCLGKINDISGEGRTILFVSHNMIAVEGLCQRVIWLDRGKLVADDKPTTVVSRYLRTAVSDLTERSWSDLASAPGNDQVRIIRAAIKKVTVEVDDDPTITVATPFDIEVEFHNLEPGAYLHLSIHVFNQQGIRLFNTGPLDEPNWHGKPFPEGRFRSSCHIPGGLLNDGVRRVQLLVVKNQGMILHTEDDLLVFEVRDNVATRGSYYGKWPGLLRPSLAWSTEFLEPGRHHLNHGSQAKDP